MADPIPTRAQLESLEHDEREAVIFSALDQRLADLARLKRIARATSGRANSIGAIPPLRASINRLIARAAEFDIRLEVLRAA